MPDLLLFFIGLILLLALAVGAAFLGRFLYSRQVRRALVGLLGKRESVRAAERGLSMVIEHLLTEGADALESFAADEANEDRHALEDVAARMSIVADELRVMALPKSVWAIADVMEKAAREIADQAGRVGSADSAEAVLDALGAIDMSSIRDAIALVDKELEPQLEAFHVNDPAVYGGGLYI